MFDFDFNPFSDAPVEDTSSNLVENQSQDLGTWHQQAYDDTCAIVSQEFILEDLTGQEFSEEQLRDQAIDNGWYTPGEGTSMEDVGKLLEANGIETESSTGNSIDDLVNKLEEGEKVIVGVDSGEIWGTEDTGFFEGLVNDLLDIPDADADHAFEAEDIDRSDPDNPMLIVNDPGHPDGMDMEIPLEVFEEAWNDSDNFMVATDEVVGDDVNLAENNEDSKGSDTKLGGYYNSDGTYHYTSDDTNRDSHGNIIY